MIWWYLKIQNYLNIEIFITNVWKKVNNFYFEMNYDNLEQFDYPDVGPV